ncbi:MAG: pilus assembly protein, partial [Gammaproteobacteria bacterium]
MIKLSFKSIFSFVSLMLVSLLLSATAFFEPVTMPYATIASYAVNTTNLESVPLAYAFRPWFENGSWQGDIVQYDLLASGSISTTVDLASNPPGNSNNVSGAINWSARLQFIKNTNNYSNNYFKNTRKIITSNGSGVIPNQIPFTWNSLSASQKSSLDSNPVSAAQSDILDFIRGSKQNEVNGTPGGLLRQRYSILGDIIHADPVYVAGPSSTIYDPGYALYKRQNILRAPRLYVGANDGMLHVFDALTGDEVYAYIPSMLIGKLNLLANLPYQHQYYVDGALTAGDMDFGSSNWHSILVGSLGAGGKGLFALDISDPDLTSESSVATANKKVLWELDGNNPDIGYIYDKSEIAKLPDGNWYIVTGNGYGSTNDVASLLLIDQLGIVTTLEANIAITANGLSRPTLIDTNGDGAVDFAYAGDLQGNLYRFDLATRAKADLLFSAGSDQPITTAPKVTNHPTGGRIILFGTGSLLSKADVSNSLLQSLYGIRDTDVAQFISGSNLVNHTLSPDMVIINPPLATRTIRTIIEDPLKPLPIDWTTSDGWKVDLPLGERVVLDPNLRAGRFQVMSINPATQDAWLIQPDFYDGAANNVFYDLNDDQIFDSTDTVNFPVDVLGVQTGPGDIPIAVKQGTGAFSRQLITRVVNGVDANFINGLGLPIIAPPKTGKVPEGFARGHIDVDTDSPDGGRIASNPADQYCYDKGNRAAGVKIDAAG